MASCHASYYPIVGRVDRQHAAPHGPGLLLMGGGTDVDAAFQWMQRDIAGSESGRGGDLVVLTASDDNAYTPYVYHLAPFGSVRTISLPPCANSEDLARAALVVDSAQAVFFAGGDQANYVRWKGSNLAAAVQRVYDRGGVVGGTSAGLAILGQIAFDAVAGDRRNIDVHTRDAVGDPYEPSISFTVSMFRFPALVGVITDTHFRARDRFGRLAAFMARELAAHAVKGSYVKGIGVDQRSALVVDSRGIATLLTQGPAGRALFLRAGSAQRIMPRTPLLYRNIRVTLLDRAGQRFNLFTWTGDGTTYNVTVDGRARPIYAPADPYVAPGRASSTATITVQPPHR